MKVYLKKEVLKNAITREHLNSLFDNYGREKLANQPNRKAYFREANALNGFITPRFPLPYVKIQDRNAFVRVDHIIDYAPNNMKVDVKKWFSDVRSPENRLYKEPLTFFIEGDR